jgi:hypothetical protein
MKYSITRLLDAYVLSYGSRQLGVYPSLEAAINAYSRSEEHTNG